jgi:hypothetical protein
MGWGLAYAFTTHKSDGITVSAPYERVDLEALKATKARRKGADTVIPSLLCIGKGWASPRHSQFGTGSAARRFLLEFIPSPAIIYA